MLEALLATVFLMVAAAPAEIPRPAIIGTPTLIPVHPVRIMKPPVVPRDNEAIRWLDG